MKHLFKFPYKRTGKSKNQNGLESEGNSLIPSRLFFNSSENSMQSRCENRYSNRLLADGTDGTAVAASPGIIPIIIAGEEYTITQAARQMVTIGVSTSVITANGESVPGGGIVSGRGF